MDLKNNNPVEYNIIQNIWNLRNRHLVKGATAKYVFHLVCCYEKDCIHPECKAGPPDLLPVWYPGGPPVSFLPLPVPDTERYVHQHAGHLIAFFFPIYQLCCFSTLFLEQNILVCGPEEVNLEKMSNFSFLKLQVVCVLKTGYNLTLRFRDCFLSWYSIRHLG